MKQKGFLLALFLILMLAVVPICTAQTEGSEEAPGYGTEEASGYGSEEASGYGTEEASGYGSEEASGYGTEEASGYGSEEASGYGSEEEVAPSPVKRGSNSSMFILTAIACGVALGWVLQRGRFCMNSAFRDTIFIQDMTYMHAYLLAVLVAIIGANLLKDFGIIKLGAQPFWPIAHIVGGYVFGLGIVLAGGCGSGIWYRVGEGMLASWVAVLGFFIGIGATMSGVFQPLYTASRKIMLLGSKPTLYQAVGADSMMSKWILIGVLTLVVLFFIRKSGPLNFGKQKGYYWSVTGLLIGIIAVVAFYLSYQFGGGFARGLSFTTPTIELFNTIINNDARPTIFPLTDLFGYIKTTWGVFFIVGVPLGAYLSARGLKEFSWKVPPARDLVTVFGGSLMMGFGATLALGCNMGQGITGVATLSIGSIVATIAIILGNWTMVYFKFIKPMQDMDLDDDDL